MKLRVDSTEFGSEIRRHQLRFCCEECAFFFAERQQCAHGWPTSDHRRALYERERCAEVVFCKEFELA